MYCKYCGNELKDDSVFCNSCGTNLSGNEENQTPIEQQDSYIQTIPAKKKLKTWQYLLIALAAFVLGLIVFMSIIGLILSSIVTPKNDVKASVSSSYSSSTSSSDTTSQVSTENNTPAGNNNTTSSSASSPKPTASSTPASSGSAPSVSVSQKNAVKKAKEYLNFTAFSYQGLIDQLIFDKFSKEDATYGVDNCGADWNEQAAKKAKSYLSYSSFSRQGLIDQLLYEKFTKAQATYGVNAAGL